MLSQHLLLIVAAQTVSLPDLTLPHAYQVGEHAAVEMAGADAGVMNNQRSL